MSILQYVRVSHDTDVQLILDLMLKRWELEIPNLVMSVTGGAKSFVLKPRLKEVFRRGLIKAAKSTSAWIITGVEFAPVTAGNVAMWLEHWSLNLEDHTAQQNSHSLIQDKYIVDFEVVQVTFPSRAQTNHPSNYGTSSEALNYHI